MMARRRFQTKTSRFTYRKRRSERGAALLLALAAVVIVSFLTFGITQFSTQHHTLANTQKDSVLALNAAEAALNWEMNKLARRGLDPATVIDSADKPGPPGGVLDNDPKSGPSVAGGAPIQGKVQVWVTDPTGSKAWTPPSDFRIFATATVNGVTRKIGAFGSGTGLGDQFTLYGINSLSLADGGSRALMTGLASGRYYIGGAGTCTIGSDAKMRGTVILDRLDDSPADWSGPSGWDWIRTPTNYPFPTVDQIGTYTIYANAAASGVIPPLTDDSLEYFAGTNDNNKWIKARDDSGALVDIKWPDSLHDKIDSDLFDANETTSSGKKLIAIVLAGNPKRFASGLQPGSNFYLTSLELPKGRMLEIQNGKEGGVTYGPVRVWIGPKGLPAFDYLKKHRVDLTDGELVVDNQDAGGGKTAKEDAADPSKFFIYQGSRLGVKIGDKLNPHDKAGHPGLYGLLYAYNADGPDAIRYGSVQVAGDLSLRGGLIAWNISQKKGTLDAYLAPKPRSAVGGDALKYVLFYELFSSWQEWSVKPEDGRRYSESVGSL